MIAFCTATSAELPQVRALLEAAHLPTQGLEAHILNFILALDSEQVVGCAGLEIHQDSGLLRSVVVAPGYQGHGIGTKLTQGILELAQHKKLTSLSLLTTTAQGFFTRFGFTPVERSELPQSLWASAELQGACPKTAVAMTLPL
ncbi:arsenic resistance N-acetyltransferase ArsN2 [Meiothermus rufus]|uniref:arsenic resistance N-acetyltransferase ArsN2 n=1 Tax=Meiothermus rufus TaxID=604332 RepID=UPI0003FEAE89|nr:arsenic resistance N-acetyltransferase ArsN2 [Meiothermus rufus]